MVDWVQTGSHRAPTALPLLGHYLVFFEQCNCRFILHIKTQLGGRQLRRQARRPRHRLPTALMGAFTQSIALFFTPFQSIE